MWILLQVYFKDFVDTFGNKYFKNPFLWRYFSRILCVDFRIATYLKIELSQKYS